MSMLEKARASAAIAVSDIDRAKRFYSDTLGIPVQEERPDGVVYSAQDSEFLVYPSQFAGTSKATCMYFDVGDVNAAVQELRGRGITFEEYDLPGLKTENGIAQVGDVKGAWFKDPDGNILAVGER
jgi:catechol 2,3-dioxygenase-like lactoylglutathione lyase family enzyme